ncbi:MAG: hypothetical protein H6713_24720 [Myxococcales bacterium]|nr:hypothetical protein [Myxococcales bacterium]
MPTRTLPLLLGLALSLPASAAAADIPPEEPTPTKKGCSVNSADDPAGALATLSALLLLTAATGRRRRAREQLARG